MTIHETETIEYKRTVTNDIVKEISAFATTRRRIEEQRGISQSAAGRLLCRLCAEGKIITYGKGKNVYFMLPQ